MKNTRVFWKIMCRNKREIASYWRCRESGRAAIFHKSCRRTGVAPKGMFICRTLLFFWDHGNMGTASRPAGVRIYRHGRKKWEILWISCPGR